MPIYILDETTDDPPEQSASRWWLHGSLESLAADLARMGSRLTFRRGRVRSILPALIEETQAAAVSWNRRYEPQLLEADANVKALCRELRCEAMPFNASALVEPWDVSTPSGKPYQVFAAFWRQCRERKIDAPLSTPGELTPPETWPASESLHSWQLRSGARDYAAAWHPGEPAAYDRFTAFVQQAIAGYAQDRNYPGLGGTSRLSPHLHFGEIGPRQVSSALANLESEGGETAFFRQLMWREFCRHLLHYNPQLGTDNLRTSFDRMPWRANAAELDCWRYGTTGYPLVDAGMRELLATGWMHNRARMVVASFLTKHLLTDWRIGAAWFSSHLVDADTANNCAGWQWSAGTGVDAVPYFRVFNPVLQSRRYDPQGAYLRKWVPEIAGLPDAHIHAPWIAPASALQRAGVVLGREYPYPVVEHSYARKRALEAYASHVRGALKPPPRSGIGQSPVGPATD